VDQTSEGERPRESYQPIDLDKAQHQTNGIVLGN